MKKLMIILLIISGSCNNTRFLHKKPTREDKNICKAVFASTVMASVFILKK